MGDDVRRGGHHDQQQRHQRQHLELQPLPLEAAGQVVVGMRGAEARPEQAGRDQQRPPGREQREDPGDRSAAGEICAGDSSDRRHRADRREEFPARLRLAHFPSVDPALNSWPFNGSLWPLVRTLKINSKAI